MLPSSGCHPTYHWEPHFHRGYLIIHCAFCSLRTLHTVYPDFRSILEHTCLNSTCLSHSYDHYADETYRLIDDDLTIATIFHIVRNPVCWSCSEINPSDEIETSCFLCGYGIDSSWVMMWSVYEECLGKRANSAVRTVWDSEHEIYYVEELEGCEEFIWDCEPYRPGWIHPAPLAPQPMGPGGSLPNWEGDAQNIGVARQKVWARLKGRPGWGIERVRKALAICADEEVAKVVMGMEVGDEFEDWVGDEVGRRWGEDEMDLMLFEEILPKKVMHPQ